MSGFSIHSGEAKDAGDIALVHVTSWQETYRGLIPDRVLDSLSIEQWTEMWRQILEDKTDTFHRIFIAQAAERVIGFASFGKEREGDPVHAGELYAIYVLREFQHKGIGRSLVQNSALGLLDLGIQSMRFGFYRTIQIESFMKHWGVHIYGINRLKLAVRRCSKVPMGGWI